jgi:hypothetical protein
VKSLQAFFVALAAALVAIPGINLLSDKSWWPLENQAFQVASVVVGSGVLGLIYLSRERVRSLQQSRILIIAGVSLVGAVLLVSLYRAALTRTVIAYRHNKVDRKAFVPFFPEAWASAALLKMVNQAIGPGPKPVTTESLTLENIRATYAYWGPDDTDTEVPATWRNATLGLLLVNYSAAIGLVIVSFGVVGVRLQAKEETPEGPAGVKVPEVVPDKGPVPLAANPAPAAPVISEERFVILEIRVRQLQTELALSEVRAALRDEGSPAPNGRRVAPSAPSIALLAVAAAGGWMLAQVAQRTTRSP